jgi:hypothetical protein
MKYFATTFLLLAAACGNIFAQTATMVADPCKGAEARMATYAKLQVKEFPQDEVRIPADQKKGFHQAAACVTLNALRQPMYKADQNDEPQVLFRIFYHINQGGLNPETDLGLTGVDIISVVKRVDGTEVLK